MSRLSEPEMLQKAVAGDTHAFRWLVEKHQGFAYSLSFRFVGNSNDAEDITQEAFVRLWKHLPVYRFEIKLTTWLYKIITNLCLDFLKSKRRRMDRNIESISNDYNGAGYELSDQPLLNEEFRIIILKLTEILTPKQKAVFVLRDLQELPMNEVSDILSMSAGNIKSNLYYARAKMSELVKQYYHEQKSEKL